MKKLIIGLLLCLSSGFAFAAGGGQKLEAQTDLGNVNALQRGAKMFMGYCSGCHSLQYMRYSRLMEDLELSEDQLKENFIFGDAKPGDLMTIALDKDDAKNWFGVAPPDLSVVARSKGKDWIYTFLKSFYVDGKSATGWNNVMFPGTSMPNVLWELQGIQHHTEHHEDEAHAEEGHFSLPVNLVSTGQLNEREFDDAVIDLVTFLEYVGEPGQMKRKSMGIWVLLYLSIFTFLAYLLKAEYWRDVH